MTAMKHSTVVTAPFSGNIVPLNKVPDETFASGVLGEGTQVGDVFGVFGDNFRHDIGGACEGFFCGI